MLDTWIVGLIRTFVPVAIGALLTWLLRNLHVVIDDHTSTMWTLATVTVVTGVYYGLVHWAEQRWPALGRWLLAFGLTSAQPSYARSSPAGRKYADGGVVRRP